MSELRYRLRKNTPYALQFTVPAGTTPALQVNNGGTYTDYAGATETVVDGTRLTINIDPLATEFPERLAIVDTATGNVMHDVRVQWSDNPYASVPAVGSVDLSRLAFDPATQTELNSAQDALNAAVATRETAGTAAAGDAAVRAELEAAQNTINSALATGLAGKENVGTAAAQAEAVRTELRTEILKQFRTVAADTTLTTLDEGNVVEVDAAGPADTVVTVPADATAALPVGSEVCVTMIGAGPVAFAAEAGVTLRSVGGALRMTATNAKAILVKRAANDWLLSSPNLTV